MGNWRYFELIATFYKALFGLMTQNVKINDAIHRTFDDFWFLPEDKNVVSNMVVLIQYIDVLNSLDTPINSQLANLFNTQLNKINSIQLEAHLNLEEIQHFVELIEETRYKISPLDKT